MISKDVVKHIAKLARLELTEQEVEKMQKDMTAILDYFNVLQKVKSSRMESETKAVEIEKVTRKDVATERSNRLVNDILAQVPARKDEYIKVKQVL